MPDFIEHIDAEILAIDAQIEALTKRRQELWEPKQKHLQSLGEIKLALGQPDTKPSSQAETPPNPGPREKQEEDRQSTPPTVIIKTAIEIISAYGRPTPTLLLLEALNERGVVVERYRLMALLNDSNELCFVGGGWWITARKSEFTRY
jgi:hypothetical protein